MLARSLFIASFSALVLSVACGGEEFSGGGGSAGAGGADSGGNAGVGTSGGSAGSNPGGSGGGSGASGAAGTTAGGAPVGGSAGVGGGVTDSGAGSGGTSVDGCVLRSWYPDHDKDGYGRSSGVVESCEAPEGSYAEQGGDCNDDAEDVFPGQTQFFGEGYATASGTLSFDYDCSMSEEGDPSQYAAAPPNCTLLMAGGCKGQGFVPTNRGGAGQNPLCGSQTLRECNWDMLSCSALETDIAAKRCH